MMQMRCRRVNWSVRLMEGVGAALLTFAMCLFLCGDGAEAQTKSKREAARANLARLKAMPPVRGVVFHCCSCAVMCPCMVEDKDVTGCNIVRIYHITDGGYAGKSLNGLTVVFIPHPEALKKKEGSLRKDGKPIDALLYLPAGISQQTQSELLGLLSENNMATTWNVVLSRQANISFHKQTDGYDVEIPGVFHATMRSARNDNGKPIIANHLKLSEGSRWHIGRSTVHEYQDGEEEAWHWNYSKKNGSWTFFAWGPHIDPSNEHDAQSN